MFGFLLELIISFAICGALAYFFFLSAPVDELGGGVVSAVRTDEAGIGPSAAGPYSLGKHPDTWWGPFLPWYEDSPLHGAYLSLLSRVLHLAPAAAQQGGATPVVYTDGSVGYVHDGLAGSAGATGAAGPARRGRRSRLNGAALGRGGHRNGMVGGAGLGPNGKSLSSQQASSPLRRESTHWVAVLVRWFGILLLGGGTTSHEVWSDRLWCGLQRAVQTVNTRWDAKVTERDAAMAAQQQQQQPHRGRSSSSSNIGGGGMMGRGLPNGSNSGQPPLVRVHKMELGAGLARDPPVTLASPGSSGAGTTAGGGTGGGVLGNDAAGGEGGASPAMPSGVLGNASILGEAAVSLAASLKQSAGTNLAHWAEAAASAVSGHTPAAAPNSGSSNTGVSSPPGGNNSNNNNNVTNSSTVSNAGEGIGSTGPSAAGQPLDDDSGTTPSVNSAANGNALSPPQQQQPPQTGGGGPHVPLVGVVLPRIAGDIVSVEIPFFTPAATEQAERSASGLYTDGSVTSPAFSLHSSPVSSPFGSQTHSPGNATVPVPGPSLPTLTPVPTPLRTFCVPILYEDHRFLVKMNCCLPLTAFLPVALAIPSDVLSLECGISIRRVCFHGNLHAAFHGASVELTFPATPHFTAHFDVSRPASRGGRMASSATTTSAFIATSTMRNVVSVGGGNHVGTARPYPGGAALPPPPLPLAPASSLPPQQQPPMSAPSLQPPSQQSQQQQPQQLSPAAERNEKIQEMVLLAVKRAIDSITYPNVLEGRMNIGSGAVKGGGLLVWNRKPASLPLYT